MFSLAVSLIITAIMVGIVVLVGRRRPPGTPLTWGEAFVAAAFVFALLVMLYGVVPDRFLRWADGELKWRSDEFGIPMGPLHIGTKDRILTHGVTFFGRGKILITLQDIRDVVATMIYVVFIGAQVFMWSWWQKRGKEKEVPEIETSAYGRPLLRKV